MPDLPVELIDTWGRLPFPDDRFAVVYACSVFSHLPEDLHLHWLAELRRVLEPRGVLIASTLSRRTIAKIAVVRASGEYQAPWQRQLAEAFPETATADVDAGRFVFGPHPRPEYGQTIIPRAYVETEWSRWFDVIAFRDEGYPQAIIVARRPA